MREKELADTFVPSAEDRVEWQSFLGLLPVLDLSGIDPLSYQRCLAGVWRLQGRIVSRQDLQRASGLEFEQQFEFLLAQLVRDQVLEPIVSSPFRFQLCVKHWTNPESAYGGDDRRLLIGVTRQEQAERLRFLEELQRRLESGCLSEKRTQQLRKEWDELHRIYEATWLELVHAIGGGAAQRIRQMIEQQNKPRRNNSSYRSMKIKSCDLKGEG